MFRIIGGVCGIISQLGGWAVLFWVIAHSPWFSWREEYISVLGVTGTATRLFNGGFILTGLLSLVFAVSLGTSFAPGILNKLSMTSLILNSVALIALGIFPRTISLPHSLASAAFSTFVPLSLFLVEIVAITTSHLVWGISSLTAGIITIVVQVIPWPWSGGAIPQLLSYLPWSLWMIGSGLKLILN